MALVLTREVDQTGLNATYWRVIGIQIDPNSRRITCNLGCWLDEASYLAGKRPAIRESISWLRANSPIGAPRINTILADIEAGLLLLPQFTGATQIPNQ